MQPSILSSPAFTPVETLTKTSNFLFLFVCMYDDKQRANKEGRRRAWKSTASKARERGGGKE